MGANLGRVKNILRSKQIEIIILVAFILFSLRVVTWFEYPNILISGDYRPQLIQEAFSTRVTYTWDQTDFGMPSVYAPRILVPSYFFMTIFNILGANTFTSQMAALFLMMFLSTTLMFFFAKQLLKGDVIASIVAGAYLTSNIYMINDREVTAVAFLDTVLVILPCIIMFAEGIRRKSYKRITFSGFLFTLTYGSFPNYRNAFICLVSVLIVLIFYLIQKGFTVTYNNDKNTRRIGFSADINSIIKGLKYTTVFTFAAFLASIWLIAILWNNFDVLTQTYGQMGTPSFVYEGVNLQDTLRLITKWGFYSGYLGNPYVPYANEYLQNPGIIVYSYLPTIIAFAGLLTSKSHKTTAFFSIIAVISLALASGFNPYFGGFYLTLVTNIPLMMAFREAAQWTFFVVISFSILIGITSSFLTKKVRQNALKIATLGIIITVLFISSYPLTIGDISRNPLKTDIKGSYFPSAYEEINNMIDCKTWALLIPEKSTYVTYNFSGTPLGAGNIYPLIFSKPIISGLGTEYMESNEEELIENIYSRILRDDGIAENKIYTIASQGKVSASSFENDITKAEFAIDSDASTRWASQIGMPQWFEIEWQQEQEISEIKLIFESAYPQKYTLQTWNGTNWIIQCNITNNNITTISHIFDQGIRTNKVRLEFTEATSFGIVSIWEIEVYSIQNDDISKSLGIFGIKNLIVEKTIIVGNLADVNSLVILNTNKTEIQLVQDWKEASLYENPHCLEKIYTPNQIFLFSSFNEMFSTIESSSWSILQQSAFINSSFILNTDLIENLQIPEDFSWQEISPTNYLVNARTNGSFLLGLLESYDSKWKVNVNGNSIPESNHIEINGYANGWIIKDTGDLTITVEYEAQKLFTTAVLASLILPALLIVFLYRKSIKNILTHNRLKP